MSNFGERAVKLAVHCVGISLGQACAVATVEEAQSFFKQMETPFLGEMTAKPGADISQNQVGTGFLCKKSNMCRKM